MLNPLLLFSNSSLLERQISFRAAWVEAWRVKSPKLSPCSVVYQSCGPWDFNSHLWASATSTYLNKGLNSIFKDPVCYKCYIIFKLSLWVVNTSINMHYHFLCNEKVALLIRGTLVHSFMKILNKTTCLVLKQQIL